MVSRRQLLLGALASSGVLTGCASAPEPRTTDSRTYCMSTPRTRRTICTPEPVPSAAVEADAKRFEATPGALTVYVVRSAWVDAVRPLTVSVDGDSQIGTLPRSLIRLRLAPGTHQLAFEWNERVHGFAVYGEAGELRIVELAGSSVPLDRPYHWSDADPAGAKLRARTTRLIADAQWTSSASR
ncbi:MAG: hypothetical protein KIT35_07810 [Piscinibacter sp.]|uniref:hypothetical protein n=1 Tax=Piscinibacter sp. TaxID=1903157 RepID=UPI00258799BE|nr:hypothetical protein [Piscinibacter sp.]MCW5663724.1 hypothetical protein [Piscinibacter sp.]